MSKPVGRMPSLITGNPDSAIGLVFLAGAPIMRVSYACVTACVIGFPDNTVSAWGPVIDRLKDRYRILSLCFPDFEEEAESPSRRWGYDFDELVDMMHAEVEREMGGRPTVLLVHDWGSHVGLLYQNKHPDKVKAVVAADVLLLKDDAKSSTGVYKTLVVLAYQGSFALAYVAQQLLGDSIGNGVLMTAMLVFSKLVPFLFPTREGRLPRGRGTVKARMCYPYFVVFKQLITTGSFRRPALPQCPVLYMVT